MKRFLVSLAFALPLSACAADATSTSVGREQAPIINGVASGPEDDAAVWVGILSSSGYPQGACSGSFIADNVVLTARHCVSKLASEGVACNRNGTPIAGGEITGDYKAEQLAVVTGSKLTRSTTAAAKGQQVFTTGATNLCNNDIAIIVLDRHVEGAKIAQLRLDSPPKKGEKILAVGWGVSNNSSGYGRRRRADIPILALGGPTGAAGIAPNEFEIGEGICSGDSGGPAFSMETGAVLGVVSRGGNNAPYDPMTDSPSVPCTDTPDYKTHNIYTRVDGFKDLFAKAFAAAGAEPWLEGAPDPRKKAFGATCDGPDACQSGICIDTGSGKLCTDPCVADGATCPEGYTCTPVDDTKVCAPSANTPANGADGSTDSTGKSCAVATPGASGSCAAGLLVLAGLVLSARRLRRVLTN